jgi:hypothetical protein
MAEKREAEIKSEQDAGAEKKPLPVYLYMVVALAPLFLGFVCDALVMRPGVNAGMYMVGAVAMFGIWHFVGRLYARRYKNLLVALLVGNSVVLLALAVFCWQNLLVTPGGPGYVQALASMSQWSSMPFMYLGAYLSSAVFQFGPDNAVALATVSAVLGTLLLLLAFCTGYSFHKNAARAEAKKAEEKKAREEKEQGLVAAAFPEEGAEAPPMGPVIKETPVPEGMPEEDKTEEIKESEETTERND